jgi:hypothetical protein
MPFCTRTQHVRPAFALCVALLPCAAACPLAPLLQSACSGDCGLLVLLVLRLHFSLNVLRAVRVALQIVCGARRGRVSDPGAARHGGEPQLARRG